VHFDFRKDALTFSKKGGGMARSYQGAVAKQKIFRTDGKADDEWRSFH